MLQQSVLAVQIQFTDGYLRAFHMIAGSNPVGIAIHWGYPEGR